MIHQSYEIGCMWKPGFLKSDHCLPYKHVAVALQLHFSLSLMQNTTWLHNMCSHFKVY